MKSAAKPPLPADPESAASNWIARRDAGMTGAEQAEFVRWISSPENARAFARHEQTWAAFDQPRLQGSGPALARELRKRVSRRRRIGAATSGLAALVAAGFFWHSALRPPGLLPPAPSANAVVVLAEQRVLPDGSSVQLRRGAEIAVDFTGHFRRVFLRKGEAHFQVAKDRTHPFIVTAGGVEVRAVGTAFAVQLDRTAMEVLVTEGRVAVDKAGPDPEPGRPPGNFRGSPAAAPAWPAGSSGTHTVAWVDAGNRVVVELARGTPDRPAVIPVSAPELTARLAWRSPRLEFTGTRLADAVALMNRYNRVQFVVADPAVGQLEVSGYFRADNIQAFTRLIEEGLNVTAESSGDTLILRQAP